MVRFDQIAEMISERIDPAEATVDRYVGLEHLDPESLHISRWGHPSDVKGTKLRFYTEDIIFGRRRAYQRKLAVADFEGICSAHAMVLRAKPDVILPDFLPFFMQSELFFERALQISVGSLSPTINWKTLARQEFPLPPLDEQRRIAEILWASEKVILNYGRVLFSLKESYQIMIDSYYFGKKADSKCLTQVREIAKINKESLSISQTDPNYVIQYIDIATIFGPGEIDKPSEYVFSEAPSRARRIVRNGDILVSMVRPYHRAFAKVSNPPSNLIASTGIAVISPSEGINTDYLYHSFFTSQFMRLCESRMTGTNYPAIKPDDVNDFEIPLPSFLIQEQISEILNIQLNSIEQTKKHQFRLMDLKKQLVNDLLGNEHVQ
jgi:type I restriction enzyme S subunit